MTSTFLMQPKKIVMKLKIINNKKIEFNYNKIKSPKIFKMKNIVVIVIIKIKINIDF